MQAVGQETLIWSLKVIPCSGGLNSRAADKSVQSMQYNYSLHLIQIHMYMLLDGAQLAAGTRNKEPPHITSMLIKGGKKGGRVRACSRTTCVHRKHFAGGQ